MNVFVAGATGAIGRPLVAQLIQAGHRVVGTTRTPTKAEALRAAGAEPVVVDAFDTSNLRAAVLDAKPEVVVNQLTDLSAPLNPRKYGRWLETTNRLREEIGPLLVDAAREAGARRIIAQSITFITAPEGPAVLDETARPWTDAPAPFDRAVRSMLALERATAAAEGIDGLILRYGFFYGPGTGYGPGGDIARMIRKRRLPLIGRGEGRAAFIHVEDAAAATVLALDHGAPGVYNVADDDPAPQREWLPFTAQVLGAKRPRRLPVWLVRLLAGPAQAAIGASLHGASNAKARRELGFQPRYPSWREGLPAVFGDAAATPGPARERTAA